MRLPSSAATLAAPPELSLASGAYTTAEPAGQVAATGDPVTWMPERGPASGAPQVQPPPRGWKASASWPPDVVANNSVTPAPDTVTAGTPVRDDGPPWMTCQPLQELPLAVSTAAVPPAVMQNTSTVD